MRIEYWDYSNLNPDGTFRDDPDHKQGKLDINPRMDISGFHHLQTASTIRDGLWLMVTTGRLSNGNMYGITIYFDNEEQFNNFEQTRKIEI